MSKRQIQMEAKLPSVWTKSHWQFACILNMSSQGMNHGSWTAKTTNVEPQRKPEGRVKVTGQ